MYMNIHLSGGKRVVAVCDSVLLGKVFEDGDRRLDLKAHASFFKGKPTSEKDVLGALKEFDSVNIIGPKSTQIAIKTGLFCEKDLLYIKNLPYIHIYRI